MLLFFLLFIPALWLTSVAQAQSTDALAFIHKVEQPLQGDGKYDDLSLAELMDTLNVPGLSIAVIKDFEIHWAKAYGVSDVETGALVNNETLFQAASISKPIAAMAVMKAVQNGHFSLDDDINSILTSWQLPASMYTDKQKVTPRMLTSHTAGLGDGFGFPGYAPGDPLPTMVQILNGDGPSNVGPVLLDRPPMHEAKYSGGGVTMMQLALTDAVGASYEEYVEKQVLKPLGMVNSTFAQPLPAELEKNAARAHDKLGNRMNVKWHVYPELAAAGLWTTATDLAQFAIEMQKSLLNNSNKVLTRASAIEMVNPVGVGVFAVGFYVQYLGEGWYFGHTGSNLGYRGSLTAHKAKGYGVIILTNGDNGSRVSQHMRNRVARVYGWDSLK